MRDDGGKPLVTDGPFAETTRAARRLLPARRREPRRRRSSGRTSARRAQVRHGRAAADPGVRAGLTGPGRSPAADAVARDVPRRVRPRGRDPRARGSAGDVDRAEEAVQDAYAVALDRWPRDGVPSTPAAWILTTAKRRAIDRLRREAALRDKQALLARELEEAVRDLPGEDAAMIPDERLGLVFACCHPALALEAQVPLTLRLVGGLTVPEIARALLLPEATVAQRLVRAKKKVRAVGHPARRAAARRAAGPARAPCSRCSTSCSTRATRRPAGDALVREDLAAEAIRLARVVHVLLPDEPEPAGLLALMLLHHCAARGAGRRGRRARAARGAGPRALGPRRDRPGAAARRPRADAAAPAGPVRAAGGDRRGPRAGGATPAATDWRQIALLYARARRASCPSPVVTLNRAVAVAMADGPAAGLRADRRARARRRARRLPPAPRRARGPAAARRAGAARGGGRLRARAGAGDERGRAALPGGAAGRVRD